MTSPPLELRPADARDRDAIAEIWLRGWRDGHVGHVPQALLQYRRLEDFLERVPARLPVTTVAVRDGQVIGFVMVLDDEVEQVYVAEVARGSGAADALLSHAERTVAARFEVAWLAVAAGNTRARRFYERQGWRDAEGFEYAAHIPGGTFPVPCRRYERRVRGG
jgi:ribosomal protein S18 acetylase RimI-like enzyme